ncbi:uncharacterized protein LOC141844091 [Curcuma longa]|uniref:uncharacterized protein LOC141844091 n=1 Tax=Curcuma longa TaxID=136217 RepID=UPI003D9E3E7C
MDSGAAVESQEVAMPAAVALDFADGEVYPSTPRIPRRIQRRFRHSRSGGRTSMEDIEAKLRDAEIRRKQFHDWLSTKARPKPRSPSWSSQDENPGQRLEAKLVAAEQKRLSLLAKAQMRLARLDELRQAAKCGVKMRFEKEREELGTRVESRVQQAEENRMRLLKAHMQRKAAIRERIARSVSQRIIGENRYKECVRSAIFQKRAAAEKKRMGLLEAEKRRAHARVVQARKVAKIVHHRRETERKRMKEQLENRLQKARRQRAEYLKQRGSPHVSARVSLIRHGEFLSKKLARCWRRFVRSRRTTLALAKAYDALKLNEKSISVMPFEQVALLIESSTTLQTAKALLDRLESRFSLLLSSGPSSIENIDHLLKRLASPNRKIPSSRVSKQRGAARRESVKGPKSDRNKSRYPVRVVLCAYMILEHPNAVFSGQGEREVVLRQSAINFIREFELLVNIILNGPNRAHSLTPSAPVTMSLEHLKETSSNLPMEQNFRCQLRSFDSAWCSYLYRFVVWKAKDARSLEEDLIRAACQMELSMMQTCKMTAPGKTSDLSHDMMAIQRQVIEDQKLLREKVLHLSGNAGLERMESSLSDARTKFFEAKENGSPLANPVAHISSPLVSDPSAIQLDSVPNNQNVEASRRSNNVVRSLFGVSSSAQPKIDSEDPHHTDVQSSSVRGMQLPTENELLVNEIMHWNLRQLSSDFDMVKAEELSVKVKETMEKAFWDEILDSLQGVKPDYSRLLSLLKEVRDELCDLAPQKWKADIINSIDLDILSQVLESGTPDTDYLGNILEYVLAMLQKLSAPANEDSMKKDHQILLNRLAGIAESNDKQSKSSIVAAVEGLRFILEQIQTLKKEVSFARIKLIEPIIKGSGGLEYLQKAFTDRFGYPNSASNTIPLTHQWLDSTRNSSTEEWTEHIDVCTALSASHGLPTAALRTGGAGFAALTRQHDSHLTDSGDDELLPECSGEKVDKLLRLGLVKLASVVEGLTMETLPETLNLNVSRLRSVQSQFQQIIVTATSILVLRQFLLTEGSVTPAELESIISNTARELSEFLKTSPDVSIQTITEMLMSACSSGNHESRKEMVARMLTKSLRNGDAVFEKVSKSVYVALRGVVLGGNGEVGRKLADVALRRIGAAVLVDQIVGTGSILIMMAIVTHRVHGPWYRVMV